METELGGGIHRISVSQSSLTPGIAANATKTMKTRGSGTLTNLPRRLREVTAKIQRIGGRTGMLTPNTVWAWVIAS